MDENYKLTIEADNARLCQQQDAINLFFGNRYMEAPVCRELPEEYMAYERAEDLVNAINFETGGRYNVVVSGNFIFGDFIEAFIVENNVTCERMMISTLSMSQNNVDSLANLLNCGYVKGLDLIVSDHFYSHERLGLLPYIYRELDRDNRFQLATAGSHTKICMFETAGGKHIVIHGSANLRSSSNIEQFVIEDNQELFDFWMDYHQRIVEKYKTINKSIRGGELWQVVAGKAGAKAGVRGQSQKREQRD